jgi:hypothetical protein
MFNPETTAAYRCACGHTAEITLTQSDLAHGELHAHLYDHGWREVDREDGPTGRQWELACPECMDRLAKEREEEEAKHRDQDATDAADYAGYAAGILRSCRRAYP